MKNYEIVNAHQVLGKVLSEPVRGGLKFKLLATVRKLDSLTTPIYQAFQGVEAGSEDWIEIEQAEQEVAFDLFTKEELEPLPLSVRDLLMLEVLMEKGE